MKPILSSKNVFGFLLFVPIILLFTSCSKELTREQAKELIIQKYNYPKDDIREYPLSKDEEYKLTSTTEDISSFNPPKLDFLATLDNEGFITYKIELISSNVYDKTWYDENGNGYTQRLDYFTGKDVGRILKYNISAIYRHSGILTEKGKQDFINGNNFRVSRINFGDITGIVESKGLNVTEVEYTIIEKPTPIGMTLFNLQPTISKHSTAFRLYDDGWRIE